MSAFRRYTNLAATIHLLQTRRITLLNPATWDDKNDAYYMAEFKRYKNAKTVLALCFAEARETYHHWRVFAHGADGVCIEFDKEGLLSTFASKDRIAHGQVEYKLIDEIQKLKSVDVDRLPFMKRRPYEDECEYRVVYVGTKITQQFRNFPINLNTILRITLSPWMSENLSDSVKSTLKAIKGCAELEVVRSTLVQNETWKSLTARVKSPLRARTG